jgi:hypothetical protein
LFDQLAEGEAFVGGVHREPLEVLGKARFLRRFAIDDQATDLMIGGDLPFVGERLERAPAPFAGFDGEAAPGLAQGRDDEILKQAVRLDIGLELEVGLWIARPAHVARRGNELGQWDSLDHRLSPDESRCGRSAPVAHPAPALSPLNVRRARGR